MNKNKKKIKNWEKYSKKVSLVVSVQSHTNICNIQYIGNEERGFPSSRLFVESLGECLQHFDDSFLHYHVKKKNHVFFTGKIE